MARPLGENQRSALKYLADDRWGGTWQPGSGWVWANVSTTVRLLDSLAKRGLATKEIRTRDFGGGHTEPYPHYTITQAGREAAAS